MTERQIYLFVHYREADDRSGEQVHFAVSTDGCHWESVNHGKPVFFAEKGERGVRDLSILRTQEGKYIILGTDLCMSENFVKKYNSKWPNIGRFGSRYISMWESEDLVHWSDQRLLDLGDGGFGCFWGPEALYREEEGDYLIYWASSNEVNNYGAKAIYGSTTKDFRVFSKPVLLYEKEDASIVDPFYFKDGENYYRLLKSRQNPFAVILERGKTLLGKYERLPEFDRWMSQYKANEYEAPIAYRLPDGKWCLLLDYFGKERDRTGYVPFVESDLYHGKFQEESEKFFFPYGMKHGSIILISEKDYQRIKKAYQ